MSLFGLLNINKPVGLTSRDAVNRVQRLIRPTKVGHAGTLDPIATGVLVLCLGPATRLIEHVQQMPKRYRATFRLGCTSDSDDIELPVTELINPPMPTREEISQALTPFIGTIEQTPPIYSAIKVQGKKSYDLARQGKAVELKPRPVVIHQIDVCDYRYPELVLDIQCGSGFYVRSLGRDLAVTLGTAAVMTALERTAIGDFEVAQALDPKALDLELIERELIPATQAVTACPQIKLTDTQVEEINHGRAINSSAGQGSFDAGQEIALLYPDTTLFALAKEKADGRLWPCRVFKQSR